MDRRDFLKKASMVGGAMLVAPGLVDAHNCSEAPSADPFFGPGTYFDRNIPDAAHTFIGSAINSGVSVIAFTPSGGWVAVAANGGYEAHGIPAECFSKLESYIHQGAKVRVIAFPPQGGNSWVIVTDQGYFARDIPDECYKMIGTFAHNNWPITCIAFPPAGGNSWVIVAENAIFARNINDECFQFLNNYTQGPRRARSVSFSPNGGWTVYGADTFFARNIDNECYQQMGKFTQEGWVVDHVAFTHGGGWSLISNHRNPFTTVDPIRSFEGDFFKDASGWHSIWDRMAHYKVPGTSVALVQNNAVAWRTAYGVLKAGGPDYVYSDTPFQAASISKPHAAAGIVRLAQDHHLTLGDPIGTRTSWPVAKRACAQQKWIQEATIEKTLQHKGGFVGRGNTYPVSACSGFTANGGGGGFGGYANVPGVNLPTLDQILSGSAPANSPRIEISTEPGTFYYSGMGFVVLMRMLQDVTGQNFGDWMEQHILGPTGMTGSTFALTLPAHLSRAAAGHDTNSQPIPGLRNRYPESSAAGLYTNAGDLCRFVAMLNLRGTIDGKQVLDSTHANTMLTNQLGIFTGGQPADHGYFFNHNGGNYGFSSFMQGYPNLGAGWAILVNLDDGASAASGFYNEAGSALKRIYNMP